MEKWFFIDTGFKDPFFNMSFDESLMKYIEDKEIVILRFFNFSPPSITLGANQEIPEWVKELSNKGFPYVKRPTGGRAVIHSNDFTYSIVFKKTNPLIGGSVLESFRKISEGFKRAFEILGIEVERVEKKGRIQSDLCFDDISIYELSCKGKKLIGSAQARRRDVCLQQGTVHLDEPDSNFPKSTGMITLKEILKKDIELKEFKDVVKRGFKDVFHIDYEELNIEDIKI